MKRAALLGLLGIAASGCAGASGAGTCEPPWEPGVYVLGFAVAPDGKGYLDTTLVLGDGCHGSQGRLFEVDTVARTSTMLAYDSGLAGFTWSPFNSVSVSSSGNAALVLSPTVGGLAFVSGAIVKPLGIPLPLGEIHAAPGGWLVAASDRAYFVDDTMGTQSAISAGPAPCAGYGAGRAFVCSSAGVAVLDSAGTTVATLALPSPKFVAGAGGIAWVLWASSASTIVNDSVARTISLAGDPGAWAWLSSDGGEAIVEGQSRAYLLNAVSGSSRVFAAPGAGAQFSARFTDALLEGGSAVTLSPGSLQSTVGPTPELTVWNRSDLAPTLIEAWASEFAARRSPNELVLAGAVHQNLRWGDAAPVISDWQLGASSASTWAITLGSRPRSSRHGSCSATSETGATPAFAMAVAAGTLALFVLRARRRNERP